MAQHKRDDVFHIVRRHKIKSLNGRERLGAAEQGHGRARTAAQHEVVMLPRGVNDLHDVADDLFIHMNLANRLLAGR